MRRSVRWLIVLLAGYGWWLRRGGERPRLVWAGTIGLAVGFLALFKAPGQSYRYDALAEQVSLPMRIVQRGIDGNLEIIRDYLAFVQEQATERHAAGVDAYDAARDRIVLFGGNDGQGKCGEHDSGRLREFGHTQPNSARTSRAMRLIGTVGAWGYWRRFDARTPPPFWPSTATALMFQPIALKFAT